MLATLWQHLSSLAGQLVVHGQGHFWRPWALACAGGVLIAAVFALAPVVERALLPVAVVLQVTPIVAVAPLILIYVDSTTSALLLCAWIVAFFPILSNTVIGLRAVDPNLRDLFRLYRATPWQRLALLRAPSALPYFMAGPQGVGRAEPDRRGDRRDGGRRCGARDRAWPRASWKRAFAPKRPRCLPRCCCWWPPGVLIFALVNALSRAVLGHWHASESAHLN